MHRIRSGSTTNSDKAKLVLIDCKSIVEASRLGQSEVWRKDRVKDTTERRRGAVKYYIGTYVGSLASSYLFWHFQCSQNEGRQNISFAFVKCVNTGKKYGWM